jgi:uncharacterized protein (DUF111 family)
MADVNFMIGGHTRHLPVKCGWMDGSIYTFKAEFDAARDLAEELGMPVRDVLRAAQEAAEEQAGKRREQDDPGDR